MRREKRKKIIKKVVFEMKQTNILDLESIEMLIKSNNLKELSEKTGIPYDTLKNYSSGRTDIESISYRNLTLLNEYYEREFLGKLEFANIVVSPLVFDKLVDKYFYRIRNL